MVFALEEDGGRVYRETLDVENDGVVSSVVLIAPHACHTMMPAEGWPLGLHRR